MIFLKRYFALLLALVFSTASTQLTLTTPDSLCSNDTTEKGESIINCSCSSYDDTIIIEDTAIKYGNDTIHLDNSTTHWRLLDCSEVHLSGSTLLSLSNLHTLELHNISQIHIDSKFFSYYNTQLQVLEIHNSNFSTFEGSININAHKFRKIILDEMSMDETFNLLIRTYEDHNLDLIAIKNCQIPMLGEINISSRSVHQFSMENNTIGTILSGAILHTSNTSTISGNTFEDLKLLSMDITTWKFILRNNTFAIFVKSGIQVQNAATILITGNVFYDIRLYSFIFLAPRLNGSFSLTFNHFYKFERGSLQFFHTIYNRYLHIRLNAIHTSICDCKTLDIIENMTEAHNQTTKDFHQQRFMTYELLKETTACVDETGKEKSMEIVCRELDSTISWIPITLSIAALLTLTAIIVFYVQRKQKCMQNSTRPPKNGETNGFDYSVNIGYMDDSDNEEYIRK